MPRAVLVAFAIVYVVWGSTYLAIRYAVETIPPFLLGGTRFLAAGALMAAWARWRGAAWPSPREWRSAAILGTLYVVLGNGLVVWAETRIESGAAALLVAGTPFWVALVERALRGSPLTARKLAGLGLGTAGLVLLIGPGAAQGLNLVGAALVLVASVSWSIASVIQKDLPAAPDRVLAAGAQMLAGGAIMLTLGLGAGEAGPLLAAGASARSMLAWLYLVVFGSMVGFTAFTWLLAHVEPTKVATYAYVNPVVAVLLGWLLAGEHLDARMLGAMALIVGAVALILWKPAPAPAAQLAPSPEPLREAA